MKLIEQTFRALSDGTRFRILALLRGGETCVGDIVQVLGVSQPAASRHLSYLRNAGLVTVRRNGLWAFYSLSASSTELGEALLGCLDAGQSEVPQLARDSRRAAKMRKSGGCCPREGAAPADTPKRTGRKKAKVNR